MRGALRTARRHGDTLERVATTLALGGIVLLIFTAVVLRYAFSSGIIWSEEISRALFIAMTYLAISRVDARGMHFRVTVLHDSFPRLRPYLELLVNAIQLALLLYLAYLAGALALFVMNIEQRMSASGLPAFIFYVPISLGLALGSIRGAEKLWASIVAVRRAGL